MGRAAAVAGAGRSQPRAARGAAAGRRAQHSGIGVTDMAGGFRLAERSQANPLIGIHSESGNGKTKSALLLARGFVGPAGKIGMIETEAGRGEVYVGEPEIGQYMVRSITGDF